MIHTPPSRSHHLSQNRIQKNKKQSNILSVHSCWNTLNTFTGCSWLVITPSSIDIYSGWKCRGPYRTFALSGMQPSLEQWLGARHAVGSRYYSELLLYEAYLRRPPPEDVRSLLYLGLCYWRVGLKLVYITVSGSIHKGVKLAYPLSSLSIWRNSFIAAFVPRSWR